MFHHNKFRKEQEEETHKFLKPIVSKNNMNSLLKSGLEKATNVVSDVKFFFDGESPELRFGEVSHVKKTPKNAKQKW